MQTFLQNTTLLIQSLGKEFQLFGTEKKHVLETGNAKILFIDNSYIIADDFDFVN